jgi:hypothetical protein
MLILIEFNELCPCLLRKFMDRGVLPHFRRFHESSTIWTTDAGEGPPNLEPWIQWPTVHSGLPFCEHGIFHLGDGRKLAHKGIAAILSDAGIPVGVCASMNTNYRELNGYVVADPWDREGFSHPGWLTPFYQVVSRQVQESSAERGLSAREAARFGWFMLRHGLSAGTAGAIIKQLASERFDPGLRWRRACLLDRLLYDVFRSLNRRFAVRFATFFCNSTAHFQHYYWRHMEPERFDAPVPATDHPSLREAILYGYRAMDSLIGRLLRDYPEALLVLCSALSQQPWTDTTKCTFRPTRFEALLEFARVPAGTTVQPVMAEEFHLECATAEEAALAEVRFRDLVVEDQPLLKVERTGNRLFAGCRITDATVLERQVVRKSDGARQPFAALFHMVHTMRSGRHHPDGVLWVRNGRHRVVPDPVPLTCIAPSVLRHFGLRPPARMKAAALEFGPAPACFAPPAQVRSRSSAKHESDLKEKAGMC